MRRFVAGWLVAWMGLSGALAAQSASPKPNVLVVVIDDMGWEEVRGLPLVHLVSPEGRAYQRFYTSTVCSPTRYQLHFGRYAHDAFIGKALDPAVDPGVPIEHVSLAQALSTHGYRTALFGKWHLSGSPVGLVSEAARVHGFEHWFAGTTGNLENLPGEHYDWRRIDDGKQTQEATYTSVAIEASLETWWTATAGPKFAVCAFIAPHEPYDLAPPELLGGFVPANTARGRYESAVVAIDTLLGEMLTYVDTSDTYVFVLADNGTPSNAPPPGGKHAGYKTTLYEGGIHVPLVVFGPGVLPGADASLVQASDVPRTVLGLANVPVRTGFDASIGFAQTFAGAPGTRKFAFSHRFSPNGGQAASLQVHQWAVVRDDGWKLMLRNAVTLELFDLVADPFEQNPLSPSSHPAGAELAAIAAQVLAPPWPY